MNEDRKSFPRPDWRGLIAPILRSKSLRVAVVVTIAGLGLWAARAPAPESPPPGKSTVQTGFAQPSATPAAASGQKDTLRPTSPALFRLGSSYIGGFLVGFAFRKFLKVSTLIAGAVIAGIFLLKKTGLIDLDWQAIEGHVGHSFSWAQGQAGAFKDFVTGYLPSAGTAVVGAFMGVRRS